MSDKIQIHFYPDVDKKDLESGTCSNIGWQALHKFLEQAFYIKENERLVGITVTEAGIKAKIEYSYPSTPISIKEKDERIAELEKEVLKWHELYVKLNYEVYGKGETIEGKEGR